MYVVVYDITDPRRLYRVARTLNRYGLRVQKSVYECDIDDRRYRELCTKLKSLLQGADSIISYRLLQSARKEELIGEGADASPPTSKAHKEAG